MKFNNKACSIGLCAIVGSKQRFDLYIDRRQLISKVNTLQANATFFSVRTFSFRKRNYTQTIPTAFKYNFV